MGNTYLSTRNRLILRRVVWTSTIRQDTTCLIQVETKEERHGVAIGGRLVVDSVNCRFETVVRQSHEEISNVDDECARDGWCLYPLSGFREDLQTTHCVLP